jgi:hypothetical protein
MGVLGVSEGAQYDALLRGHAATLVARSEAVAAPHDRGADRAYSAENVPRIRTAEALRARRHRGRHASACPGKGILGGVRAVAPHPTRCRLHARLSHKPCAAALEPLQGWVPKSRMSFAWSRPPSAPSAIPAAAAATTADVEQVIPDDFVQHPHAGAEASVRARLLLLGTNRSSRPGADRGSQLARAIRRWQHPSPRAATRRTGVPLGQALYGSHWYGRNFPSNVMRTRGPASLSPRSSARLKLIALMMPSPKSSWMSALSAGP